MGEFSISQSAVHLAEPQSIIQTQTLPGMYKDRTGRVQLAQQVKLLLLRCSQTSNKIYNLVHPRKNGTLLSSNQNMTVQVQFSSLCQGCLQVPVEDPSMCSVLISCTPLSPGTQNHLAPSPVHTCCLLLFNQHPHPLSHRALSLATQHPQT